MARSKTLETAFSELEDLIGQMENKETSLEESFKLYTEIGRASCRERV